MQTNFCMGSSWCRLLLRHRRDTNQVISHEGRVRQGIPAYATHNVTVWQRSRTMHGFQELTDEKVSPQQWLITLQGTNTRHYNQKINNEHFSSLQEHSKVDYYYYYYRLQIIFPKWRQLSDVKIHEIKTHEEVEIQFHAFFTSVLDACGVNRTLWSLHSRNMWHADLNLKRLVIS
jgi:hypothetical protein